MDENYTIFVDKQGEDIVADVFIEKDNGGDGMHWYVVEDEQLGQLWYLCVRDNIKT